MEKTKTTEKGTVIRKAVFQLSRKVRAPRSTKHHSRSERKGGIQAPDEQEGAHEAQPKKEGNA